MGLEDCMGVHKKCHLGQARYVCGALWVGEGAWEFLLSYSSLPFFPPFPSQQESKWLLLGGGGREELCE